MPEVIVSAVNILLEYLTANWIEVFGVTTGAICVWFLAKNKAVLGWSFGVVNAAFFVVLFFQYQIYAETLLNSYYLVTCIWGLYLWKFRRAKLAEKEVTGVPVTRVTRTQVVTLLGVGLLGTVVGTWLLGFTDTDVAFLDAITTTASLIAQWMLAKKIYENWYVWIGADIIYIGLFLYKGLFLTSGLYLLFIAFCIKGLIHWKKVETEEKTQIALLKAELESVKQTEPEPEKGKEELVPGKEPV